MKASCSPAPNAIGNRIWHDINQNDIQDPEEPGIDGIKILLLDAENGNSIVGEVFSLNGVEYYFTNANVAGGIIFEHDYIISVNENQTKLSNINFISFSSANSGSSDLIDSDTLPFGSNAIINFKSGLPS